MTQDRKPQIYFSLIIGIVTTLFFSLGRPDVIQAHASACQFVYGWDYARQLLVMPGGCTDWLGGALTYEMHHRWLGACVLGFLMALSHWNAQLYIGWNRYHPLTLLPIIALVVFYCHLDAELSAILSLVCCQLAAWGLRNSHGMFLRSMLFLVGAPLLYRVVGPMTLCFALLHVMFEIRHRTRSRSLWRRVSWGIILFTLAEVICWPWLVSSIFPVSLHQAIWGVHYVSGAGQGQYWLYIAAWLLVFLAAFSIALRKLPRQLLKK